MRRRFRVPNCVRVVADHGTLKAHRNVFAAETAAPAFWSTQQPGLFDAEDFFLRRGPDSEWAQLYESM